MTPGSKRRIWAADLRWRPALSTARFAGEGLGDPLLTRATRSPLRHVKAGAKCTLIHWKRRRTKNLFVRDSF